MKRKVIVGISASLLVIALLIGYNLVKSPVVLEDETAEIFIENTGVEDSSTENTQVAENAMDLDEEEGEEVIDEMYEEIPEETIDELESTPTEELKEEIDDLSEEYAVGEPFSKEDQDLLVYTYEEYGNGTNLNQEELEPIGYVWKKHNFSSTKTKQGVKVGYSGYFKTYARASSGTYNTNVKVKIYSGKSKIKSMRWQTRHCAYGVIGSSGTKVSLGIIYNGSVKSSFYKSNFSLNKSQIYSGVVPVYLQTWGSLTVKTKSGEFNFGPSVKSTWE